MKSRGLVLIPALVGTLVFGLATPAFAVDSLDDETGLVYENDLGLLATPAEMAEMGATRDEIAHQQVLLDDLSSAESVEQAELRVEQDLLLEELGAMPALPEPTPPPATAPDPGTVSPMIYVAVCWPGNDYYSVYYTSFGSSVVDCFAESGTYRPIKDFANTVAVRPGNNIGRVYYPQNGYWYWSPWRGKSMSTYYFNGAGVTVQRVQIQ